MFRGMRLRSQRPETPSLEPQHIGATKAAPVAPALMAVTQHPALLRTRQALVTLARSLPLIRSSSTHRPHCPIDLGSEGWLSEKLHMPAHGILVTAGSLRLNWINGWQLYPRKMSSRALTACRYQRHEWSYHHTPGMHILVLVQHGPTSA